MAPKGYPKGLNKDDLYVSIFAICEFTSGDNPFGLIHPKIKFDLRCDLEAQILTSDNQICVSHDKSTICWGFPKFVSRIWLILLASSLCTIKDYSHKFFVECDISYTLNSVLPYTDCPLPYDIGQLLKKQKFSDIKLKVNRETLCAQINSGGS